MSGPHQNIVDSHVHFWDPASLHYGWLDGDAFLRRPFLPGDLAGTGVSISGVIAVQADCDADQSGAEVAWLQMLADRGAPIIGIVAGAALERGTLCTAEISAHAAHPLVVGVRRLIQDEAPGFALRPDFVDGVRLLAHHDLVMDLCIRQHQISEVTELANRCPDITFVLDHLGKPQVGQESAGAWQRDMARLAALPNTHCKLSGLSSELSEVPSNARYIPSVLAFALDVFGPNRCMFGSDWPVSSAAITYVDWLALVDAALVDLTDIQRQDVMGETAMRVYGRASRPQAMVAS